jgi:hypothetical protein
VEKNIHYAPAGEQNQVAVIFTRTLIRGMRSSRMPCIRGFRVCERTRKKPQLSHPRGFVYVPQGLKAPHEREVYGTAEQAAEKLASLKGTAFRPYITAV